MGFIIIHLTDIHIKKIKEENSIFEKQESLYKACQSIITSSDKLILVISGDIAYSGKKEEYINAFDLIEYIKTKLEKNYQTDIKVILVPGNHDCDFSKGQDIRNRLLTTLDRTSLIEKETLCMLMNVQNEYNVFSELYIKIENKCICNKMEMTILDKNFLFLLINSAWMSTKKEVPGTLYIPNEAYLQIDSSKYDCVFAIMHHPYNWLHPDNYVKLISYIRDNVDILLLGHEHRIDNYAINGTNWSILECHGKELQSDNENESGFAIYKFDYELQNITMYTYTWDSKERMYIPSDMSSCMFKRNSLIASSMLVPNTSYMQYIERPGNDNKSFLCRRCYFI